MDLNYYNVFRDAGYSVVMNNTELQAASDSDRLLGIFSVSNMAKWCVRLKTCSSALDDLLTSPQAR